MLRTLLSAAACGAMILAASSAFAQAPPSAVDSLRKEAAELRERAANATNPAEKKALLEKSEAISRAADAASAAPREAARPIDPELRAKREALEQERQRIMAELKELEAKTKSLRANQEKRLATNRTPPSEAEARVERDEAAAIDRLEKGRAELAQKLKELEGQLKAMSSSATATLPRRLSAEDRFRQRLADYARSVAKLRADGNEAAALRAEAEANEFARQGEDRARVELEVMRNQVEQLRASGRNAEAAQLEKAIQSRTNGIAAAERAQAEFRAAQPDGPARPRPMTNVDGLSREAIVRRIAHFRQAQEHLQEVGRGELVEQLQREIDRLENRLAAETAPAAAPPELSRLQAENEQLKKDVASLKEACDKLTEALKKLAAPRNP